MISLSFIFYPDPEKKNAHINYNRPKRKKTIGIFKNSSISQVYKGDTYSLKLFTGPLYTYFKILSLTSKYKLTNNNNKKDLPPFVSKMLKICFCLM